MRNTIYGAVIMGCLTASVFFLSFWRKSRDRFFGFFALAFLLLSVSWWVLVIMGELNRFNPAVYVTRLAAFVVIIIAVLDKNRPFRTH
jgi:Ca2+/Na+ antiporter